MQQEIEYTFRNGTKHVIPADNKANFEKQFDKEIIYRRIVGQPAAQRFKSAATEPATAAKKQIVPFPVEPPATSQPSAKQETGKQQQPQSPATPSEDEVVVFEEN